MSFSLRPSRSKTVATAADGTVTTTEFRYQNGAVVEERVNGTVLREFVTDDAGSISKLIVPSGQTDAGTYLVTWNGHGDALNLLRVNSDGTTTLATSFTYDSWGTPTTSTHNGIGNLGFRYLYVGQFDVQWDNSFGLGLHYMHARHYSPMLGRFLQPDPIRAELGHYAYAEGNPTSHIDPTGQCTTCYRMKDGGRQAIVRNCSGWVSPTVVATCPRRSRARNQLECETGGGFAVVWFGFGALALARCGAGRRLIWEGHAIRRSIGFAISWQLSNQRRALDGT